MDFLKRWFGPKSKQQPLRLTGRAAELAAEKDEATRQLLATLLHNDPHNGEAQLAIGMLHLREYAEEPHIATLRDAVTRLTRATELLPDSSEALFYLAFAESFTLDTIDEAEAHLRQALQRDPQLAERAGEIEARIAAGKQGMQQQAIDPDIVRAAVEKYEAGQRLAEAGNHAGASTAFEEAIALYPAYAEALLALGESYRQLGRLEDAIRVLRRALAVRPRMFEAHVGLGSLYVQTGDQTRALEQLQLALGVVPDQPQVLRNVGLLQLATGQAAEAAATFRRLSALDPLDPEPRLHLALAALQSADHATARDALTRLEHSALNARQHQLAARVAEQLGDAEAAQRHRVAAAG